MSVLWGSSRQNWCKIVVLTLLAPEHLVDPLQAIAYRRLMAFQRLTSGRPDLHGLIQRVRRLHHGPDLGLILETLRDLHWVWEPAWAIMTATAASYDLLTAPAFVLPSASADGLQPVPAGPTCTAWSWAWTGRPLPQAGVWLPPCSRPGRSAPCCRARCGLKTGDIELGWLLPRPAPTARIRRWRAITVHPTALPSSERQNSLGKPRMDYQSDS